MHPFPHAIPRRRFLVGLGLAATCISWPARTQPLPDLAPDGFRILRARAGTAALRGAGEPATAIVGYDGAVPGPALRLKRGEELRVRVVNELPEPTAVHWHGLRLPNAVGGMAHLAQPPIAPGGSFDYRFRPPDAGTFWYHPSPQSPQQRGRGLHGLLVVEEGPGVEVDRDVGLLLEDWRLAPDGGIDATPDGPGRTLLTGNGAPALDLPVRTNERLRLRLVNTAVARALTLRIDRHAAWVMAIDSQPAEPFLARDSRLTLAPGCRADLFIDATLAAGDSAPIMVETAAGGLPLARLVYGRGTARAAPLPEPRPLPPNPLPERLDLWRSLRVNVPLDALATASTPLRNQPPLATVRRGRVATFVLINRGQHAIAAHIHGHYTRLLDRRDDGWKPFWLDTVVVPGGQTERVAFLAENVGRWLLDVQAIERPERASAWYEVD
jgi:FtsP/CotA-like multicopper oxidase with cupredoxin domain